MHHVIGHMVGHPPRKSRVGYPRGKGQIGYPFHPPLDIRPVDPPARDIWWWSLETCSNFLTRGPPERHLVVADGTHPTGMLSCNNKRRQKWNCHFPCKFVQNRLPKRKFAFGFSVALCVWILKGTFPVGDGGTWKWQYSLIFSVTR